MNNILWVDDNVEGDLYMLTHEFYINYPETGTCLDIALTISSAIRQIKTKKYDCIILDKRLPTGFFEDIGLKNYFTERTKNGILLAKALLTGRIPGIETIDARIVLFSTESVDQLKLDMGDINNCKVEYLSKSAMMSANILWEFIFKPKKT